MAACRTQPLILSFNLTRGDHSLCSPEGMIFREKIWFFLQQLFFSMGTLVKKNKKYWKGSGKSVGIAPKAWAKAVLNRSQCVLSKNIFRKGKLFLENYFFINWKFFVNHLFSTIVRTIDATISHNFHQNIVICTFNAPILFFFYMSCTM